MIARIYSSKSQGKMGKAPSKQTGEPRTGGKAIGMKPMDYLASFGKDLKWLG